MAFFRGHCIKHKLRPPFSHTGQPPPPTPHPPPPAGSSLYTNSSLKIISRARSYKSTHVEFSCLPLQIHCTWYMHFHKKHKYHFKFLHTLVEGGVYSMGFFCMRQLNIYVARALSRLSLSFKGLLTILCFVSACYNSCSAWDTHTSMG